VITRPNKTSAGNSAVASRFHAFAHRRAVPEMQRSATLHAPLLPTMNLRLIASFVFLLFCCLFARAADMKGKVVSYGIFTVSGKDEIVRSPETPSGVTRIPAGNPLLTAATNRIPAKIGVRFGMWYQVGNVVAPDGEIEVTKIARHPTITKPDGTTSQGFTFIEKARIEDGSVLGWTGYGFDHPYELVPGRWEFEMAIKGKTVCKHEFTVFKE
jgi:Domain of unknown function (DUF3859)